VRGFYVIVSVLRSFSLSRFLYVVWEIWPRSVIFAGFSFKNAMNVEARATVCKTVGPILLNRCLSCPVCDVCILWPNGWMDQDEAWHAGRPRPWPYVLAPLPQGDTAPNFQPISVVAKWLDESRCHLVWPWPKRHCVNRWGLSSPSPKEGWQNGWMDQDGTWYGGRPRLRPYCARWDPAPLPRKGGTAPSNFRPVSVMAGWIKMPLGTEVGQWDVKP